jgi:HEAT repeat protein
MKVASLIRQFLEASSKQSHATHNLRVHTRTEYLQEVSKLTDVQSEISEALMQLVDEPCKQDATLWILAAQLHPSDAYIEPLQILLEDNKECIWHEGIVEVFQELKDERVIPSLVVALNHRLDYDPGYAVPVRILETLADIGTPKAFKSLNECLKSTNDRIREEAQIMLDSLSDD